MSGRTAVGERGLAFQMTLHVVLVLLIIGQVVYLASQYRSRVDLTEEQSYTLTESTRRILSGLDDRLLVEAYFSPDEQLSAQMREGRAVMRAVLDEFVQASRGRMTIQWFDPLTDNEVREKAKRLGIQSQTIGDVGDRSLAYKELWQGFRFRYAGGRQKIVPILGFSAEGKPFDYEAALTPVIKGLTVSDKPVLGVATWASPPPYRAGRFHISQREGENGFEQLFDLEAVTDRYEVRTIDLSLGSHIADRVEVLILIRPRDLEDRAKYVVDQFLMRGGKLVVFCDTADYGLGQQRTMNRRDQAYDSNGSTVTFLEQLASYGAAVGDEVVLDGFEQARERFVFAMPGPGGRPFARELPFYPYWFRALPVSWSDYAERIATSEDGEVDNELAASYAELFLPGIADDYVKTLGSAPFFWPCPVELVADAQMPAGVQGEVVLRTSPFGVRQPPPTVLSPTGAVTDGMAAVQSRYRQFLGEHQTLIRSQPRNQIGLMVNLTGTFPSFFDGKSVPRVAGAEESEPPTTDPLAEDVGKDPLADPSAGDPQQELEGPAAPAGVGAAAEAGAEPEAPFVAAAPSAAQLVVVGDTDFIRDDLITGTYANVGGPISRFGPTFFVNLLDLLARDQDLFELRNKSTADRTLRYLEESLLSSESTQARAERIRSLESRAKMLNIVVPPVLLLCLGLLVLILRKARKRAFLNRIG